MHGRLLTVVLCQRGLWSFSRVYLVVKVSNGVLKVSHGRYWVVFSNLPGHTVQVSYLGDVQTPKSIGKSDLTVR